MIVRILYVGTDVEFPGALGGSRRILEIGTNFAKMGYYAVVFTAISEEPCPKDLPFTLYRHQFIDIISLFRTVTAHILKQKTKAFTI